VIYDWVNDEFLVMVSHDLRSPLNAILGCTRLLRSDPVDKDASDISTEINMGGMALVIERGGHPLRIRFGRGEQAPSRPTLQGTRSIRPSRNKSSQS
jgi:signal transduction histidine kinase